MATSSTLCPIAFLLALLFLLCATSGDAATFNCNATGTCRSLVGFKTFNATTFGAVQALFQVPSLSALLGANALPTSTLPSAAVPANATVLVPIPCRCANGTGRSDRTPVYTVRPGDQGLYNIAFYNFGNLVRYQEIVAANNISNPDVIEIGQRLWIPLPCSCDAEVGAEAVVHLAHRVAKGSTLEGIAGEFGTNESTLMALNEISDPKTLQFDQILDVPLRACTSSISNTSVDYNYMRLANDSYALTANDCVLCSCSSTAYQLECYEASSRGLGSTQCEVSTCPGNLRIGNSSSSGCHKTTCSYAGFTNASLSTTDVLTVPADRNTCTSEGTTPLLEWKGFTRTLPFVFLNIVLLSLM